MATTDGCMCKINIMKLEENCQILTRCVVQKGLSMRSELFLLQKASVSRLKTHQHQKDTFPGMKEIGKDLSHCVIPWSLNVESVCLHLRPSCIPHFEKLCSRFTIFAKGSLSCYPSLQRPCFPSKAFLSNSFFSEYFLTSPIKKQKLC